MLVFRVCKAEGSWEDCVPLCHLACVEDSPRDRAPRQQSKRKVGVERGEGSSSIARKVSAHWTP